MESKATVESITTPAIRSDGNEDILKDIVEKVNILEVRLDKLENKDVTFAQNYERNWIKKRNILERLQELEK